jgi:hypothetical protein
LKLITRIFFGTSLAKSSSLGVDRKEDKTMRGLFNGQGILGLDSLMGISALKDEMERYGNLPNLMNLFGKLNGFFDNKFESYWEENTGLTWKEWGKL